MVALVSHFLLFIALSYSTLTAALAAPSSSFNESLLLRPTHDAKLLLHWQFELHESGSAARHFTLFPKALGEVLNAYSVDELSLSLSSGRWRTHEYGYLEQGTEVDLVPTPRHAPHGAELSVLFDDEDEEQRSVDTRWRSLKASLSGLFCSSLNQMSATTSSDPSRILFATNTSAAAATSSGDPTSFLRRYATLPRESVCTENLAPFVKMLPCRGRRGLAAMLDPVKLYSSRYHSIQIRVRPYITAQGEKDGYILTQSVSVLLDPMLKSQMDWKLSDLLKQRVCACPLSNHATLHVHLNAAFQTQFPQAKIEPAEGYTLQQPLAGHQILTYDLKQQLPQDAQRNSICPAGSMDVVLHHHYASTAPLLPLSTLALPSSVAFEHPIRVERYLSAPTLLSGRLYINLHNPSQSDAYQVQIFDSIPWFCKVRYSTLNLAYENGTTIDRGADSDLLSLGYVPAVHRGSPAQFYYYLRLLPSQRITISLDFDKAILTTNEYPPDVSRGFDIPSAIVKVGRYDDKTKKKQSAASSSSSSRTFYTDGLLVTLPFPDFSMPFNVIAFTSTILAFFYGSLFNMTQGTTSEVLKRREPWTRSKGLKERLMEIIEKFRGKKKGAAVKVKSS